MQPFLYLVAQDLRERFGSDLSRMVIVFPNKRAGLFMNDYLLSLSDGAPVWAPRYMTINDLFFSLSDGVNINDPIDTTLRIVRIFRRITGDESVSVERFYGWAERILADFEDVDKNMADATALFRNVSELKAFDDTSFLTEEQVAELQKFFSEFRPDAKSQLREKFQQLWDALGEMYVSLNAELAADNVAYEGALYRKVVERLKRGEVRVNPDVEHFVFVGFNVLDRVEHELFKILQKEGRTLFYWDYDNYYVSADAHNEAGLFMQENLLAFPNALKGPYFDNLTQPKHIEMVAASTEAIQAQYVAPWLEKHLTDDPKQTAVVLCNENMLQPVLHGLPENVRELNVTKGFPLSRTGVVTDVEHQLGEWERHGSSMSMAEMVAFLAERVEANGRQFVNAKDYNPKRFEDILQGEAYFQMFTILNRFAAIAKRFAEMNMTLVALRRLIRQVVRQTTIPFHGEPAAGLQVMGVLETRCLDFEHIIMLSTNDGVLPKKANDNSFIPYLLRKAFELTTPERRTAVYAYYFYRLLQRASVVTMAFNNAPDGISTGEMSRFMTQLMVEWPGTIAHKSLNSVQRSAKGMPVAEAKPDNLLECLMREAKDKKLYPSFSPSALSVYLKCPLQFYFKYVRHLHEPKVLTEEMQSNIFGSIFHQAAEDVYKYLGKQNKGHISSEMLKAMADDSEAIAAYVKDAFRQNWPEYRQLEASVIEVYLSELLRYDARNGGLKVLGTERKVEMFEDIDVDGRKVKVRFNGVIDRLDYLHRQAGDYVRVLDYKTGVHANITADGTLKETSAKEMSELFVPQTTKGYIMQTFIYCLMLQYEAKKDKWVEELLKHPVAPALFFIKYATNAKYVPLLKIGTNPVTDFAPLAEEFRTHLHELVGEILDPKRPFEPTEDTTACDKCAFRMICLKRNDVAKD